MGEKTIGHEEDEEIMIEQAFQRLVKSYLDSKHRKKTEIIQKAFNFAKHAHKGIRRLSGEPYIMHPIAVAQIVSEEIGLGSTSICAALLHDVVEDTEYTVEDIENMFGPKIAQIVEGLTKIAGGIFGENTSAQAENFKKILLTMNEDIRVILIKMADRLHNMRTLGSQPKNKQYKIAGETMYIYAPLAHRLGLNQIKNELENLCFKYEHPEEYQDIVHQLEGSSEKLKAAYTEFVKPIEKELKRRGVVFEIRERIKTPFSIWKKMKNKNLDFSQVYDILAVRIVFEPKNEENVLQECFNIYVAMCNFYTAHPNRLRDWVTHPKANGYQALHVTLMSKQGEWVEVQIRSRKMDDVAEKGVAAHWKYKKQENEKKAIVEGNDKNDVGDNPALPENDEDDKNDDDVIPNIFKENEIEKWLTTIKEVLDDPQPDAIDFLDTIKLNLFTSEIFVFTPKGELKTLPINSTVLDFAFSIHTILGSHCIGAKVNHKLVALSHKLKNGDQVEIISSNALNVKKAWLGFATTAKAKNKIQGFLNKIDRENRKKGEQILKEFFEKEDLNYNTMDVEKICKLHNLPNQQKLFLCIGEGRIVLGAKEIEIVKKKEGRRWKRLLNFGRKKEDNNTEGIDEQLKEKQKKQEETENIKKNGVTITDDTVFSQYVLPDCCNPIPGDDIMGYMNEQKNIIIHRLNCKVAARLKANHGNRIIYAEWKITGNLKFLAIIELQAFDRIGLLNNITQVISNQHNVNMKKLVVTCDEDIVNCTITLMVRDKLQIDQLIDNLKKIEGISSAVRKGKYTEG